MNLDHKPHIVFFALTEKGNQVACDLHSGLQLSFKNCKPQFNPTYKVYSPSEIKTQGGLAEVVHQTFNTLTSSTHCAYEIQKQTILVFICAVGIAVRILAPYIKDKLKDPACIVIDDHAKFAISLLSGHIGKANTYTAHFASCLESQYNTIPVITTATDNRGVQGFEEIMSHFRIDLEKNRNHIKVLNAALANGQKIGLLLDPMIRSSKDYGSKAIITFDECSAFFEHKGPKVLITLRKPEQWLRHHYDDSCLIFYSQSLVIGSGCRKNVSYAHYHQQLIEALAYNGFSIHALGALSSVALKTEEPCMVTLAETLSIPFLTHTTEALSKFTHLFEGSDFVEQTTGIRSIAGPSAYIMSEDDLTFKQFKKEKCTFSFGRIQL